MVAPVRLMIDASLSRVAFCSLPMCCAEAFSWNQTVLCCVLRIIEWAARSFRGIGLLWTTSYHGKRGRFKLRPPWNDATRPCLKYPSSSMSPTLRLSDRSEPVAANCFGRPTGFPISFPFDVQSQSLVAPHGEPHSGLILEFLDSSVDCTPDFFGLEC